MLGTANGWMRQCLRVSLLAGCIAVSCVATSLSACSGDASPSSALQSGGAAGSTSVVTAGAAEFLQFDVIAVTLH